MIVQRLERVNKAIECPLISLAEMDRCRITKCLSIKECYWLVSRKNLYGVVIKLN
jgi:hypothetical protein